MDLMSVWLDRISALVGIVLVPTSIIVPILLGIKYPTAHARKALGFTLIAATIAASALAVLLFADPAISILAIWVVLGLGILLWGYRTRRL